MTCGVVHLQFISFSAGTNETSNCISAGLLAATIQSLTFIYIYYKLGSNLGRKVALLIFLLTTTSCFIYKSESSGACTSEATRCIDTHLLTVVSAHSTFIDIYGTVLYNHIVCMYVYGGFTYPCNSIHFHCIQ